MFLRSFFPFFFQFLREPVTVMQVPYVCVLIKKNIRVQAKLLVLLKCLNSIATDHKCLNES